jgi:hypothetical protein
VLFLKNWHSVWIEGKKYINLYSFFWGTDFVVRKCDWRENNNTALSLWQLFSYFWRTIISLQYWNQY